MYQLEAIGLVPAWATASHCLLPWYVALMSKVGFEPTAILIPSILALNHEGGLLYRLSYLDVNGPEGSCTLVL